MKKLFLKNGDVLNVKARTNPLGEPFISVFDSDNETKGLYVIIKTNDAGMRMEFSPQKNHLAWDEISFVAEISENFNQYFNNLNQ